MHFSGCRCGCFCCSICVLVVLLSKSRRICFVVEDGSVSGDGHRFRCCTVGELLRDSDWVSVIAVRKKYDEKGLRADEGHRSVRCRQLGRAPVSKREKGRTPSYFRYCQKKLPRYIPSLNCPTRRDAFVESQV